MRFGVAANGQQLGDFFRASFEIDASQLARQIEAPTLVIAGDQDTAVPVSASRHLAALIPGARFKIIEDGSHVQAAVLDPRVKRMVSDFLAE